MRVLIVKLSPIKAITSSMYRTLAIAHGLLEQGYEVNMLVTSLHKYHVEGTLPEFAKQIQAIEIDNNKFTDNIRNRYVNIANRNKLTKIVKKLYHSFYIYDCNTSDIKNITISMLPYSQYDIIISSSDPKSSHLAVNKLIQEGLKYKKWIQYWGDPLTIDMTIKRIYPKFMIKKIEYQLLSKADKIVYVSPFTLCEQKNLFKKIAFKMNFLPIAYMEKIEYPVIHNEKFVIDYYGSYRSDVRNLKPFYDAMCDFGEEIYVHIVGDSDIELKSTNNIEILPRGIKDELQKKADLIVCVLNKKGTQIPGKIYHMAGTNKRILCILDGDYIDEFRDYLMSFERFYLCDNNIKSIRKAIIEIRRESKNFKPLESLSFTNITKKFIEMF